MTPTELPALRADSVVGFLAAIGVLRLLAEERDQPDSSLCWPDGALNGAVITSNSFDDTNQLAGVLFDIVEDCRHAGERIPGVPQLPLYSSKSDPMNSQTFLEGRHLANATQTIPRADAWLSSMISLSVPDDNGTLKRSRWWAVGPGPVTIAGTLDKAMAPITSVADMTSALVSWRRHDWVGGYLDESADVGKELIAGTHNKDNYKMAVIGATWLALMATPLFQVRATTDKRSETVGWHAINRKPTFTYPVWSQPLSIRSVAALLDHPEIHRTNPRSDALTALGVTELRRSTRLRSGNNNAAVTHPVRIWPNDGQTSDEWRH